MLFNAQGLVFAGRRKARRAADITPNEHEWQMPQGGIDEGETPYRAALRELREETNVRSAKFLAEAPDWLSYDLPGDITKKSWKGRFRGQTQKWFALQFTGEEFRNRHCDARRRPSQGRIRRLALGEDRTAAGLIVPFKRKVYESVCAQFAHLAKPVAEPGVPTY